MGRGSRMADKMPVQFYDLDPSKLEKESSVYAQQISPAFRSYSGLNVGKIEPVLSESAIKNARFFTGYILGTSAPGRPDKSEKKGYYIENANMIAFRGVGGKDMASVWHMLAVLKESAHKEGDEIIVDLKWLYDLKPEHLPMVKEVRETFIEWVYRNRSWFETRYSHLEDIHEWLKPENLHIGCHKVPSVGLLHFHLMIGPLTDFGGEEEYREKWVPIENIISILEQGETITEERIQERRLSIGSVNPVDKLKEMCCIC